MSQTNKSTTVSKIFHFSKLNKALASVSGRSHAWISCHAHSQPRARQFRAMAVTRDKTRRRLHACDYCVTVQGRIDDGRKALRPPAARPAAVHARLPYRPSMHHARTHRCMPAAAGLMLVASAAGTCRGGAVLFLSQQISQQYFLLWLINQTNKTYD